MDAAVSLHVHGALPLPASSHHHLKPSSSSAAAAAASAKNQQQPRPRLAITAVRPSTRSGSPLARAAAAVVPPVVPVQQRQHRVISSNSAATGYAAALADASLRSGTLHRAARHARALLLSGNDVVGAASPEDARVVALVRMLVGKGKATMVADVMAEFAAICDRLLIPARAHAATTSSY